MLDTHDERGGDERGGDEAAVNRMAAICEYVETYGKWPRTRAAKRDAADLRAVLDDMERLEAVEREREVLAEACDWMRAALNCDCGCPMLGIGCGCMPGCGCGACCVWDGPFIADRTEALRKQLAAATARAEKAERQRDVAIALGNRSKWQRDEARAQMYLIIGAVEHAYALNAYVELEPGETAPTVESLWAEVREIRGVAADASPDGRSATGTDDGASGGAFHGNTSSITPQGLSEAEGGCPWCGTLQKLDADGLVLPHEHPTYCDECPGSTRRPNNDTTEDGQRG